MFIPSVLIFFVLLTTSVTIHASSEFFGLDDWGVQEAISFFKKSGLKIDTDALQSRVHGIEGSDILHLSSSNLQALGINDPVDQGKYAVKAAEEIKKLKANVVDPFQWRALNRRTCDFWLIP